MADATDPPIESDVVGETAEEKTVRLNFFSDSVRAGLHAAATDILTQMQAAGVPDASACLMTGSCQYVAELYEELADKLGLDKGKVRDHLLNSVELYFNTYCEMSVKDSLTAAVAVAGEGEGRPH